MKQIILATGNKHKVVEIKNILKDLHVDIKPMTDFEKYPEVIEDEVPVEETEEPEETEPEEGTEEAEETDERTAIVQEYLDNSKEKISEVEAYRNEFKTALKESS